MSTNIPRMSNSLAALTRESVRVKRSKGTLHTPGEIWNQCAAWKETARLMIFRRRALMDWLDRAGSDEIILTGAGSSHLIGKALEGRLQRTFNTRVVAIPSTDMITHADDLLLKNRTGLMISFSRSGDTPETVRAVELALKRSPRWHHLVITCNSNGAMARLRSHKNVLVVSLGKETCDRGLAMTTSVTNMYLAALFLSFLDTPERYRAGINRISEVGSRILSRHSGRAENLAAEKFSRVVLIGSGPLHAAAREGALKITELTDGEVATLGESFLGIRHGPLTMIHEHTCVMYLLSSDPSVHPYEADLIRQIRQRKLGAVHVAIGGTAATALSSHVDHAVDVGAHGGDAMAVPLTLLFPQMFALFSSLARGLTPDDPSRRGVIDRVVKGVRIRP